MAEEEPTGQSALDAWGGDSDEETENKSEASNGGSKTVDVESGRTGRSPYSDPALSDDAVLTKESCPWCLHPSDEFREKTNEDVRGELIHSPQISCDNCSAVIPVEEGWYQRGEKICVPYTAKE